MWNIGNVCRSKGLYSECRKVGCYSILHGLYSPTVTVIAARSPLWWPVWGFSHCGLCVVLRPGQTEAGLLLHRHLLPQQHLRVRVLLLPTRVTVHSPPRLPAKDQGNKVVFLAPSTRQKKTKKKNKSQLWLFPLCHTAASKPVKQPTLPVHFHPSEREEMETGCHVIAKAPSSLSSCVIPSLVAHFRDYRGKIPFFVCASDRLSCNPLLQCNYV